MISDEPYRTSTQYRLFSYASPKDLFAQRSKANSHSRSQLSPDSTYLTVSEEIELIDYYVSKLWDLCRLFKVPSHVKVLLPLLLPEFTRVLPTGRCNKLPTPLLLTQHPINNASQISHPNSFIPRCKNRKCLHSTRIL